MRNYFKTVSNLTALITVLCVLGSLPTWAADDVSTMLFGPGKKISANKNNPLIPKISKTDPQKKNISPKIKADTSSQSPKKTTKTSTKKEDKSLTEKIKQIENDIDEKIEEESDSLLKDTWVEKLSNTLTPKETEAPDIEIGSQSVSLDSLTHEKRKNSRSNAAVFDISGVMLRMSLNQAESALIKRGFKPVSKKYDIPNFIKWRYEEQCRNTGVIGYERLNSCVVKAAKENNYQFVQSSKYVKDDSKEEIEIWLTSNFTNNKVYKVTYSTNIVKVNQGSSKKTKYLHNIKTYEFWRRINQKYGVPDNKTEVLWGMGNNKPYLKAYTGKLLLEDPMLRELDYTRMSREDARFINSNLYNF